MARKPRARLPGIPRPLNPSGPDALVDRLPLAEVPVPARTKAIFPVDAYVRTYRLGECSVIVTREFGRWHVSVAHQTRDPTWREISQAWYRIVPGPNRPIGAIILPRISEYINIHRHCFHINEIDDPGDRSDGRQIGDDGGPGGPPESQSVQDPGG